jgi:GLPGLI family protein
MKALILLPFAMAATILYAQPTSGTITFQQTIALNLKEENLPEGMAGLLPSEQKVELVLYFSPNASLYENKEKEKSELESGIRQGNVMIQIDRQVPQDKVYTDLKNKEITELRDFMGRMFLIKHPVDARKWKFSGNQKKILEMACMEAVCIDGKDTITAWYTTAIPVNAGPPGMILEAHSGSNVHIVATKLDTETDASKKIKIPSKGKKVTEEEYEKMVAEKTKEMQEQYGGDGNIIIMRQTR